MAGHSEKKFESEIVQSLTTVGGYIEGDPKTFDRERALFSETILKFVQETQPKAWSKLSETHGGQIEDKFLYRLTQELANRGPLDVLRNGITDYGVKLNLAYFKPATGMNPETKQLYEKNILTVTRQVRYSTKNENSVDLVLALNGIPLATIELKSELSGQDVTHAKRQYSLDRDPAEPLFQFRKRALVHFSLSADEIWMTTKLDGKNTRYLPFNKGDGRGAGNPPNPNGHKTAYFWEEVLERDSWMDILGRFVHLQTEEIIIDGKKHQKETMIFPRYHQLDVVRKLTKSTETNGCGKNYLIQHSTGSGKSNSIAWLAYRLSNLHDDNDKPVYDSIIVISDRTVLDQQLQDTIFQFEHKHGVVEKIDKDSNQLAEALGSGTKIIITTLQKFPYVIEKIESLPKRKYAVIADEAHRSQGGESSRKLKEVLATTDLDTAQAEDLVEDFDPEENIRKVMSSRGPKMNLSFFAFTATPKSKTLELFGEKQADGTAKPFHLYSMRQAIEEGFIMDVLENYVTYKTFYRLSKQVEDDPKLNRSKAKTAIAKYVKLHPHNLAQKTSVMVEHFRQQTVKRIGGKAKAMVVTPSRLHVIKYKQEFDQYIRERGYTDVRTLVAFSGTVRDEDGEEYTESSINTFGEKELPKKFSTQQYNLLIVANKYQTGFDQPLLHTMYVDKKLGGVQAVQTLSRLNRTHPGKEDTFVLDFANTAEEIREAFQPYYESTILSDTVDPNKLYDLKHQIEAVPVIYQEEVDSFCKTFFKSTEQLSPQDHAVLNKVLDPAVARYKLLDAEQQDEFKNLLKTFERTYKFVSQVMPFEDIELEKLYAYARMLQKKLPRADLSEEFKLGDEVALEYYRLQKTEEGQISLDKFKDGEVQGVQEAGTKKDKEEKILLSEIIDVINKKFGTDFTDADKLFFDQLEADLISSEKLLHQAQNNTLKNFSYSFEDAFMDTAFQRMAQNEEIFQKIVDNKDFKEVVVNWMLKRVYGKLKQEA